MNSKENDQVLEDELQALHQSIEQLNAANKKTSLQNDSPEDECQRNNRRKRRATQADVQTQTPKKSRKRTLKVPEELLQDLDNPIDEILEDIAHRKNLTTNNVKHLLRNIIANESVQELLKCSLDSNKKLPFEPKQTRSKTKEWLKAQNFPLTPSAKKGNETHFLIEEEFSDDDSDDEYK